MKAWKSNLAPDGYTRSDPTGNQLGIKKSYQLLSDLQLTSFWYNLVGVVVLVLVLDVLVTGVKQSQLLDLSLGLGLEFDNN